MPYIGYNVTNAGSFALIDDIASTFNESNTAFTLQVGGVNITPNVQNLIISIDGVVQQAPDAYSVSGSTITFTEAPASGADFYGILMGQSSYVENNSITADELAVSGDGSSGQLLSSDGDGTFSWLSSSSITSVGTLTSLSVNGNINLVSANNKISDGTNNILERTAGGYITIGDSAWNEIRLNTTGSTDFVLDNSGRIGIGNPSPASGLHLTGGDNTASKFTLTNTAPATDNVWSIHPQYNDQTLRFLGDSNTVLTMKDTGEVGIGGVTNPSEIFHVQGTGVTHRFARFESTNYDMFLYVDADSGSSNNDADTGVIFRNNNSEKFRIGVDETDSSFHVATGSFGSAGTKKISINSTGNIGIGGSPDSVAQLRVLGDSSDYGILAEQPSGHGGLSIKSTTVAQTWSFIANDNSGNSDLLLYGGSSAGTKLTIDSSGKVKFTDDIIRFHNAYTSRVYSGYTTGNSSFSVTFPIQDSSSLLITAIFTHYGAGIASYGCARMTWLSCRNSSQDAQNISSITSSNGGSWGISTSNSVVTVSKVAGSYSGGGHYWVKIEGSANI